MTNAHVRENPPQKDTLFPSPTAPPLEIEDPLSINCLSFMVNMYRGLQSVFSLQRGGVRGTVKFTLMLCSLFLFAFLFE